ncbi:MAG: MFS transporter [Treponema sp. GWB1_62_6]|nr:MAG: MFS transporter [Treponema sp. GWB1_62_6]OHE65526.1 MAG: MFS transporter [Treponema sp. GWC1_61_84]OHE72666.1 MAG: MFS transporter [Treponema sp. RIFOXYC1_FULL_61_9]HCM27729.1 MFS transporter [Treponema sp.]
MPQKIDIKSLMKRNRSMTAMLVLVIFVGMGEKMAERFLPLYLLALGGGAWTVGILNSMDNMLSALYSVPGGFLSDRLGHKKSLQLFTLVAMFGYLLVILIPAWQAVLVGSVFFISWTAVSLPAIMSLVSKAVPKERRSFGVSLHSFFRRIPMALGPVVGGILIGKWGRVSGVRIAFVAAFAMGAVALAVVQRYMDDDEPAGAAAERNRTKLGTLFSPALRSLLASDILIRFAEQIPYAFVVIWAVENNGLTALQFGLLTTIEMAVAMLVYIPVAWFADRYGKKRFVLMTFVFFTSFPLVLLFSRSFPMFVVAFIVRGLKEFGEPTRKALIMDLAPENAKARTFGAYYLLRDVVVSLAALSSALLWNISPATNFLVAAGFGVIGTFLFAVYGKDVQKAETLE